MGFSNFDIMGKCKKILSAVSELSVDVGEKISTVKTTVDTLATNWTATRAGYLDNIRSYTITNNTANATGTLSQKSTYIASTLIGATTNTGGTATAGTVMAKLNKLLKKELTNFTVNTITAQTSSTSATRKNVLTLSNVLLYGAHFNTYSSGSAYWAYVYLTIDGTEYTGNASNFDGYWDFKNTVAGVNGMTLVRNTADIKNIITLNEPIYVGSLTVDIVTYSTTTSVGNVSGRIYYKQL